MKNGKAILFASLIVALILPFSALSLADAAPNENANDKAKKTHEQWVNEGYSVFPGGHYIKDTQKGIDNNKSIDDNVKNGFDRDVLKSHNGKTILDLDKYIEKHGKEVKKTKNTKTNFKNHEADEIMKNLGPYIISEIGKEKIHSVNDLKEMKKLQKALDKSLKEHKEKIIDKELRKDLKKALKVIRSHDIPTTITAVGIDHVYIKLSEPNTEYENKISELMGDLPYRIDYGEGFKRGSCSTTQSDCNQRISL